MDAASAGLVVLAQTPPEIDADQVSPGLAGFLATFGVVVVVVLLLLDLVRRLRRLRVRGELEGRAQPGGGAEDPAPPGRTDGPPPRQDRGGAPDDGPPDRP